MGYYRAREDKREDEIDSICATLLASLMQTSNAAIPFLSVITAAIRFS